MPSLTARETVRVWNDKRHGGRLLIGVGKTASDIPERTASDGCAGVRQRHRRIARPTSRYIEAPPAIRLIWNHR